MLRSVAAGPQVVVCSTCRDPAATRMDDPGRQGGALLAEALRAARLADPLLAEIAIEQMPCLFACARSCAIHIRAAGRISYVLGDFSPTAHAAQAILAYASSYARTTDGDVAYRDWPEGVKGHFITRMPPDGFVMA